MYNSNTSFLRRIFLDFEPCALRFSGSLQVTSLNNRRVFLCCDYRFCSLYQDMILKKFRFFKQILALDIASLEWYIIWWMEPLWQGRICLASDPPRLSLAKHGVNQRTRHPLIAWLTFIARSSYSLLRLLALMGNH
jgi:hypothetical protein